MGIVKVFRSTDNGAPILTGEVGKMIALLQACLVDGYGSLSVVSMTHTGGIVTVQTASAHGLTKYGSQTIAGANEAGYNGNFVITPSVDNPNMFSYEATGITVDTATGTMTTKSAGAGWTKPYTGTNLAAFRQGAGNNRYLSINDTTTLSSRVVGYETMTGVSTGEGPFPTAAQFSGGLYFQKSNVTTNLPRQWILVATDKTFYLWVNWDDLTTYINCPMVGFGDATSYKLGDIFNTFLIANISTAIAGFRFGYFSTNLQLADTGRFIARSYTQIGSSVTCCLISDYSKSGGQAGMGGTPGLPYPHPVDGSLQMSPVWICENPTTLAQSVIRGVVPGIWNPLHYRPLSNFDMFDGSGTLTGKTFLALGIQLNFMVVVEISQTW